MAAFVRRLVARISGVERPGPGAAGAAVPKSAAKQPDAKHPGTAHEQPRAAREQPDAIDNAAKQRSRASGEAPQVVACPSPEPASPPSLADADVAPADATRPVDIEAGVPAAAPQPAPPVRARRSKWQSESLHTGGGRIDLAPWVAPERTYRVFVPGTLSPDPCIVMMLHGCKQTPEDIAEGTRLNEHAEDLGWIVVYPEQSRAANKYGCWNWFDPANERGDGECALIIAIHNAVRARLKLNEPRSFLAGMSAGGALASLLALRYARQWAGVAIHSGLPFGAASDPWGAQRAMREGAANLDAAAKLKSRAADTSPLPAVIMHGNEDTVVHRRNAELLVRQFLGWNGYFPESVDWATAPLPPASLTDSSTEYGHAYVLRDFGEGLLTPVRECEVVGMGHAWSGGDSAVPFHDEMGPDASALMMEFFATIAERG